MILSLQQFPDYLSKIQRPMSLDVIKKNLEPGHESCYKNFTQFVADVRQIFKNAFIYNEVRSQDFKYLNGAKHCRFCRKDRLYLTPLSHWRECLKNWFISTCLNTQSEMDLIAAALRAVTTNQLKKCANLPPRRSSKATDGFCTYGLNSCFYLH